MISFRCGRCAEWVKAEDAEAGRGVTCRRCSHVNICPPASIAPPTRQAQSSAQSSGLLVWTVVGAVMLAAIGWVAWSALRPSDASAAVASAATPAEALQQELLRKNAGQPGDPILNQLYADISAKHFSDKLPVIQVLWEPRLADVGKLAAQTFTLEGMFGHVGRKSVILLNPDLQADKQAIARALCHEMVHAYLFTTGDTTAEHGPAFQTVLRRLANEGAFEGIVSSDDERARLRTWIDAESARLDTERTELDELGADIDRDHAQAEHALADLNARTTAANTQGQGWPSPADVAAVTEQRNAYNQRAIDANERLERDRADIEHFNREVARYNLMLVYPDGLDTSAVVKTKAVK